MSELLIRHDLSSVRGAHPIEVRSSYLRIAKDAPFQDEGYGFDVFGLHPPTLAALVAHSDALYKHYFRVESIGIEHVPAHGPVILVANHGGVLPVDAVMLCLDVLRQLEPPRVPRAIADQFVPRLPLISTWFARIGVVSGSRANVRRLLERGELIAIWPEGVSGPAKRFRARYQIQRWSVGFAEIALRFGAPVIPVAIVGAEESWPLATKLGLRLFGAPYLPIPAWPIPLPARYHIQYGPPMHLAGDADDPAVVSAAATQVRVALERMIEDMRLCRRGLFR